jgi:transglutaminase-like putative cysteine protease
MEDDFKIISNARQEMHSDGTSLVCIIKAEKDVLADSGCVPEATKKYLRSSLAVPAANNRITKLASEIEYGKDKPMERIEAIMSWIKANIAKEPFDVFSALDVLDARKAECQGHAILYAALARASGIPTKVVNGIVYSEDYGGFLYHTWDESCAGDSWVSVDPTFSQIRSDATHIVLMEGEDLDDLIPLVGIIGKIKIEIISLK